MCSFPALCHASCLLVPRHQKKAKIAEVARDLFQALEEDGLTPKGGLMVYQYHPPFMPGFLRRNEVAVKV